MKTNLLKRLYSSSNGFTLIELLVVIAIVGVLAATLLVIINPGQRIATARNSRVRADISNIGSAAGIFYSDTGVGAGCTTGSYPADFANTGSGCVPAITFMAAVNDPVGVPYDVEAGPGACTTATPCTAVAIEGPAFADGGAVPVAGFWCWRSATGTVTFTATDALCTF